MNVLSDSAIDFIVTDNSLETKIIDEEYKDYPLWKVQGIFQYQGTYVHELRTFYVKDDSADAAEDSVRDIICNEESTSWSLVQNSITAQEVKY